MLKTNKEKIVIQSVSGKVHNPTVRKTVQRFTAESEVVAYPTVGAICYNVTLLLCKLFFPQYVNS